MLTCQLWFDSTDLSRLLFPLVSVDQVQLPFPGWRQELLAATAATGRRRERRRCTTLRRVSAPRPLHT